MPTSARVRFVAARQGGGELDVQGTARSRPARRRPPRAVTRVDLAVWDALIPLPGASVDSPRRSRHHGHERHPPVRRADRAGARRHPPLAADRDHPLIAAQDLELAGIDAEWPRLRIERIRAVRPTVAADRDAEGRLSLMALVPPAGPPSSGRRGPCRGRRPPDLARGGDRRDRARPTARSRSTMPRSLRPPPPLHARQSSRRATIAWPGPRAAEDRDEGGDAGHGHVRRQRHGDARSRQADLRARLAGAALGPYQVYCRSPRASGDGSTPTWPSRARSSRGSTWRCAAPPAVRELTIGERERPLITVARIDMTGLDYKWPTTIGVDRFRVERSWALLERRADGSVPLASLFKPLPAGEAEAEGRARPAPGTGRRPRSR